MEEFIVPEDIAVIKSIKLSQANNPDLLGWHYTDSGFFTVKSGYWLSTHLDNNAQDFQQPPGSQDLKTAIWKLKTAPKLRLFLWRLLTKSIGVKSILKARHIIQDSLCSRCEMSEETLDHLFFSCEHAGNIWRGTRFPLSHIQDPLVSFEDKLREIIAWCNNKNLPSLSQQLPMWILWRIWKSRNVFFYQGIRSQWQMDIQKAIKEATEWSDVSVDNGNQSFSGDIAQNVSLQGWLRPEMGYIKCNYDCRFLSADNQAKAGWILRDSAGSYLEATQSTGNYCNGPLQAELQALLMAMQHTWIKGYRHVIFEGDNKQVLLLIQGKMKNFGVHNWIREIAFWEKRFTSAKFQWVSRKCNQVADCLAKAVVLPLSDFVNFPYVPPFLVPPLHEDDTLNL